MKKSRKPLEYSTTYTCKHCGETRPGIPNKEFCYDRKPCLKARSNEKSRIYREKYREEVTAKKVKPHVKQVDGFILQAKKYADETVPRHSTDQGKAEWDGAFHSEMNRLTIGAGLRVDFS